MTKKKAELRCSGCNALPPDEGLAESGWFTVIRNWQGVTRIHCYCPQCREFVAYHGPIVYDGEDPALKWH